MNKVIPTFIKTTLLLIGVSVLTACSTITDIAINNVSKSLNKKEINLKTNHTEKNIKLEKENMRRLTCKGTGEIHYYESYDDWKLKKNKVKTTKHDFHYYVPIGISKPIVFDEKSGALYIKEISKIEFDREKFEGYLDASKSDKFDYHYLVNPETGEKTYGEEEKLIDSLEWIPAQNGVIYYVGGVLKNKAKGERHGYRYQSKIDSKNNLIIIEESLLGKIAYAKHKTIINLSNLKINEYYFPLVDYKKVFGKSGYNNETIHKYGNCIYIDPYFTWYK